MSDTTIDLITGQTLRCCSQPTLADTRTLSRGPFRAPLLEGMGHRGRRTAPQLVTGVRHEAGFADLVIRARSGDLPPLLVQ